MKTSVCLSSLVVSLAAVFAAALADEGSVQNAPLPDQHVEIAESIAYRWVFGDDSDAVAARRQLDSLLGQKIAAIDQVCGLTEIQKQKLRLAGQGDNEQLIGRVKEIATQLHVVKNDPDKVRALENEADTEPLKRGLVAPGSPNRDSFFVKVLEKLLTADQVARYEPLRAVFRTGGLVRMRERGYDPLQAAYRLVKPVPTRELGADDVMEIDLGGTAFADDDLTALSDLPGIHYLEMGDTRISDEGLIRIKEMTNLRLLGLGREVPPKTSRQTGGPGWFLPGLDLPATSSRKLTKLELPHRLTTRHAFESSFLATPSRFLRRRQLCRSLRHDFTVGGGLGLAAKRQPARNYPASISIF